MSQESEVQRMMNAIDAELTSLSILRNCPSLGGATHKVIHARMNRLGIICNNMAEIVGKETATEVLAKRYIEKMG